jgi:DNA repair photolyase
VAENPAGRFEPIVFDAGADFAQPDPEGGSAPPVPTRYLRDPSRSALSHNQSPDVGFDVGLNPYRGCAHGCSYCFARPTHEYLGLSAGLDFETTILVKPELPALLRRELCAPGWRPQVVGLGAVTDPYQPIEQKLRLTRRCLEVFAELRNPVSVVTKSALVTRDADLLAELAGFGAASVCVSITTLDAELQRRMEPRAAAPSKRLAAVETLARAGVPVAVLVAPVVPGLTDHEAPAIVAAAARAGARSVRHLMLRLPHGVKDLFDAWLERHYPERRAKVLSRVRAMRGGRLNDPRFFERHRGSGFFAEQTHALFALACRRAGLDDGLPPLSTAAFRRPQGPQLELFQREAPPLR